jgi:predicted nucleic acid-binding protein
MTDDDGLSFIDTNVLLYAYDASAGQRHDRAAGLVNKLAAKRRATTSVQVLQEFYVNSTRKIAEPLAPKTALDRIRAFSRWPTHAPTANGVLAAATLAEDAQLSFWDAMIVYSAAALGCSVLWSEDFNAGQQIFGVRVRNPFEGLA